MFADQASKLLDDEDSRAKAREICFRGLSKNPKDARGRLILAKAYYLDSMPEFALRELLELKKHTNVASLDRLIQSFGDYRHTFDADKESTTESPGVIAELDFDTEFADILAEIDEG